MNNVAKKKLAQALLSRDEGDSVWITYEEYAVIHSSIEVAIKEYGLKLTIFRNNLYPDYYPIPFKVSHELAVEITGCAQRRYRRTVERCVISAMVQAKNVRDILPSIIHCLKLMAYIYGSFYNYEYESVDSITIQDFYPYNIVIENSKDAVDYNLCINEDVDTYLRDLGRIILKKTKSNWIKFN